MTDWVETYFPTTPVRRPVRALLRQIFPAAVFATVIAGSLFLGLSGAPHNQTAFGGATFPGVDLTRALDFAGIEPASGIADPDKIGKETSKEGTAAQTAAAAPDFIAPSSGVIIQNGEHQVQAVLVAKSLAVVSSTPCA